MEGAALRSGAAAAFVTMLRPGTEVVGSEATHYKRLFGDVSAIAAWVNVMVSTELSTLARAWAFVRYDDAESEAIAQSSHAAARGRRGTPEETPKPPKGHSKAWAGSSP